MENKCTGGEGGWRINAQEGEEGRVENKCTGAGLVGTGMKPETTCMPAKSQNLHTMVVASTG